MNKFQFKMNCPDCGLVTCESICIKSKSDKHWNSCAHSKGSPDVTCWQIICTFCKKVVFEN